MSAGLFLDVVTILSGVLMLCVAFTILYNKLPEIAEELRVFMGRTRSTSEEQRRSAVIAKALQDIEAAKSKSCQSTPPKEAAIQQAPTVESPESQDDDSTELALKNDAVDKDDYIAKFMKDRKVMASPSMKSDSMADSCSVYLDGSYNDQSSTMEPMSYANMYSPFSKADRTRAASNADDADDIDALSMVYSLDTIDNKESFSSFARPSYSHVTSHILDDTTTCPDIHSHPLSFLSKHNITIASNISEEATPTLISEKSEESVARARNHSEEEPYTPTPTHISDVSEESVARTPNHLEEEPITLASNHSEEPKSLASSHSGQRLEDSSLNVASRDSFSPLARRNVTFSSTILDESSLEESSKEIGTKKTKGNFGTYLGRRNKPKITIVTNKSLLSLDEEGDSQSGQIPDIEKEITPYTVSTTGMWSPSASLSPQTCEDDLDHRNDSFSTFGYSLPSDEAADDRRDDETASTLQNVHICKSASCTACRYPAQNTPTFLSTSSNSTGQQCSLPRQLPNRWWDLQQRNYGQLKQYVSSVLLSQTPHQESQLNTSLEEHPFDEA